MALLIVARWPERERWCATETRRSASLSINKTSMCFYPSPAAGLAAKFHQMDLTSRG